MALQKMVLAAEMVDGTVHENLVPILADQLAFSKARKSLNLESMQDDPMMFINFLAFRVLFRTGVYTQGFDRFCNDCVIVGESEPVSAVDPTQKEA